MMDRIRALLGGHRAAYASGELSNGLTLVLFAALARALGVEPYGEFVTIIAVSAILSTGVEFGFHSLLTRTIAREPGRAGPELWAAHRRQILLAPILLLTMYGYLSFTGMSPAGRTAGLLIGGSVILRALKETMRGVSRGLSRFGLEATFLWTERGGLLLACVAVVYLGGGIVAVGATFLILRVLDFVGFLIALRWRIGTSGTGPPGPIIATWAAAAPFAVSNLLWSMYTQVDPALLTALATPHDAGVYGGIYRFVDLVQVIPRLLIVVTFPAMAVAWLQDRERFHRDVAALRDILMLVALPVLILPALFAAWALDLTVGADYVVGARSLQVLMVGNFFAFQSLMLWQALQAAGQERHLMWVLALTVGLKVGLNLVLAPRWGHYGTAIASAVTEAGYFLLLARLFRHADPGRAHPIGPGEVVGASVLAVSAVLIGSGRPAWGGLLFAAGWLALAIRLGPKVVADLRRGS